MDVDLVLFRYQMSSNTLVSLDFFFGYVRVRKSMLQYIRYSMFMMNIGFYVLCLLLCTNFPKIVRVRKRVR
jgi:phosphoglycerol transferase MdoB-like AlkP superfamily enzyme